MRNRNKGGLATELLMPMLKAKAEEVQGRQRKVIERQEQIKNGTYTWPELAPALAQIEAIRLIAGAVVGKQRDDAPGGSHVPKPLQIASELEQPKAKPKKAEKPPKHRTPVPVKERIWRAWRKELLDRGKGARTIPEGWMVLVRLEYPGADWNLVKRVREEVHEYNRLKARAD